MSIRHVVVDGSNLATEGRTLPSLAQLDDAVRSFVDQYGPETVTVVVDATFPNRIEADERAAFEEALANAELVTPPAGVIGRGDAFLLEIADRASAVVLSNDSFQEFHGQYGWLFDTGRLIGGKPVPHVGWVFMDRAPVRGPLSRKSVSDARKAAKAAAAAAAPAPAAPASAAPASAAPAGGSPRRTRRSRRARAEAAAPAGAQPSGELAPTDRSSAPDTPVGAAAASVASSGAVDGVEGSGRRRRSRARAGAGESAAPEPYNAPLPFIEFIGAHPVGSTVQATVEKFSSHGAYVLVGETRCYVPLANLGDPPPRSAREVLGGDSPVDLVVVAIDTPRRGIDLALPGVAVPAGDVGPSEESEPGSPEPVSPDASILADAVEPRPDGPTPGRTRRRRSRAAAAAGGRVVGDGPVGEVAASSEGGPAVTTTATPVADAAVGADPAGPAAAPGAPPVAAPDETPVPAKRAATKRATTKAATTKAATSKAATSKAATAKKAVTSKASATKASARKASARKASATKATATKATAMKTTATKASATTTGTARTTAKAATTATPAKAAPAKKATTVKAAPAKKATSAKAVTGKAVTAKKAPAAKTTAKTAAKKVTANKATTAKTAAKKVTAKKATAAKATAAKATAQEATGTEAPPTTPVAPGT